MDIPSFIVYVFVARTSDWPDVVPCLKVLRKIQPSCSICVGVPGSWAMYDVNRLQNAYDCGATYDITGDDPTGVDAFLAWMESKPNIDMQYSYILRLHTAVTAATPGDSWRWLMEGLCGNEVVARVHLEVLRRNHRIGISTVDPFLVTNPTSVFDEHSNATDPDELVGDLCCLYGASRRCQVGYASGHMGWYRSQPLQMFLRGRKEHLDLAMTRPGGKFSEEQMSALDKLPSYMLLGAGYELVSNGQLEDHPDLPRRPGTSKKLLYFY